MHWWIVTMAVLYAFSGITIIKPDEVAVIQRWGRLVGGSPASQEHGPGLLFAFPRPIDRVVRVQVKHVSEVLVAALSGYETDDEDVAPSSTLDPVSEGYAVTGDHNILQVVMVARYRIRSPGEWAFYGPKSEDVLRTEVTAAMMRSIGEMPVDRILSDGRKELIATATNRAQAGLDVSHSGLELTSLELTFLAPPNALSKDFDDVQSAYIGAETKKKDAQGYAEALIPQAQAKVDTAVQAARGDADAALALARGDADAFLALENEYKTNKVVVRERLYRDAVERALGSAQKIRWVPPPIGGSYHGFRIELPSSNAGSKPQPIPTPAGVEDDDQ
jgi:modulator of FtsH protease HflK